MKILSLFDGISCARVALEKCGIKVSEYFASEIDSYAIKVSQANYPDIIELGDVKNIKLPPTGETFLHPLAKRVFSDIDLLIGGSPCQDLSIAKKNRKGLKGDRSGLFYEYVRILNETKPKFFILENVNSMPKEDRDIISETLGVQPIMINAALVSAQQRKRLFWVGKKYDGPRYTYCKETDKTTEHGLYEQVHIDLPEDRQIYLRDIIHEARGEEFNLEKYLIKGNHLEWITDETRLKKKYTQLNGDKAITMTARQYASWNGNYVSVRVGQIGKGGQGDRIYSLDGKSVALSALGGGRGAKTGLYLILQKGRGNNPGGIRAVDGKTPTLSSSSWEHNNHLLTDGYVRKLTPIECCRLQGLKDEYIAGGGKR